MLAGGGGICVNEMRLGEQVIKYGGFATKVMSGKLLLLIEQDKSLDAPIALQRGLQMKIHLKNFIRKWLNNGTL